MASKSRTTPPLSDEHGLKKAQAMALDQAVEELSEKRASSQIVTHFLITGSEKYQREVEKLQLENELLKAKIENEKAGGSIAESLGLVLTALQTYKPQPPGDVYDGP